MTVHVPNADELGVVFMFVWPFVCGIAMRVYVIACEWLDARDSSSSRARARIYGGSEC